MSGGKNTNKARLKEHYTLEEYIEYKIFLLKRDFGVILTEEELAHLRSLRSEGIVDAAARAILLKRFDDDL